jgi:hypothetical protein
VQEAVAFVGETVEPVDKIVTRDVATRSCSPTSVASRRTASAIPAGSNPPALQTTLIPAAMTGRWGSSCLRK